jgi:hypothetical protein
MAVFKLVACYVRVVYLLDSIEEKNLLVCMCAAATRRRGNDDNSAVAVYTTMSDTDIYIYILCMHAHMRTIHSLTRMHAYIHIYKYIHT